jgi:hypothetical protein
MRAAALIPLGFFLATALVVATRLLVLWRRTRQLPEFAIGMGVVLVTVIGLPLAVAGRLPRTVATPFGDAVFGVGLVCVCAGITLFFVFTTRVFHARARWARAAEFALGIVMALIAAGLIRAASLGSDVTEVIGHTRPWAIAVVGMLAAAFGWSGCESLRCFAQLRRRRALGIGDPVVENRFLLWGIAGLTTVILAVSLAGFLAAGRLVLLEPVALFLMAGCGLLMGGTWLLTFFPPGFYLRRIGAASAAPGGRAGPRVS